MSQKKILNVGSGNQWYGTERINIIKTAATTRVHNIEQGLPYRSNTFDEVHCEYVWEHLKNPYNLLLEMKRVCKPGGKIRVITDNAGYVLTHTRLAGRTYHGDYKDSAIHGKNYNKNDRHYALYTPEHLRNFFISAGLIVIVTRLFFWPQVHSRKSRFVHAVLRFFLGQRFSQPSVGIVAIKPKGPKHLYTS